MFSPRQHGGHIIDWNESKEGPDDRAPVPRCPPVLPGHPLGPDPGPKGSKTSQGPNPLTPADRMGNNDLKQARAAGSPAAHLSQYTAE